MSHRARLGVVAVATMLACVPYLLLRYFILA